jgi:hypothetical protein
MIDSTTLAIDKNGDLVIDGGGNLALFSGIDQVAQDCWLGVQTHVKDIWYNQQYGIPYFDSILGFAPPNSLISHDINNALKPFDNVKTVRVSNITLDTDRRLHADIDITTLLDNQLFTVTI